MSIQIQEMLYLQWLIKRTGLDEGQSPFKSHMWLLLVNISMEMTHLSLTLPGVGHLQLISIEMLSKGIPIQIHFFITLCRNILICV